jgi:hypothetical protein
VDSVFGGSGPLTVLDGTVRVDLSALREQLNTEPAGLPEALDGERLVAEAFNALRDRLSARMMRFNQNVRADFPGSPWERCLALVPKPGAGMERWLAAMRGTLFLWKKINETGASLQVLADGSQPVWTAGMFEGGLLEVESARDALVDCRLETALCRAQRGILQERAVEVMKAYGHAVKGRLGKNARVVDSLPQLWPGPARGSRRGKAGLPLQKTDTPPESPA